jgi:hypothetical protein
MQFPDLNRCTAPDFDSEDEYSLWMAAHASIDEEVRLSQEARIQYRKRNRERARELYEEIVRHPIPDLTHVYADDEDGKEKQAQWTQDMRQWRAWHWAYLGFVCLQLKDRKASWNAFQSARRADSDCGAAWIGLFWWTFRFGKWRVLRHYLSRWNSVARRIAERERVKTVKASVKTGTESEQARPGGYVRPEQ